MVKEPGSGFTSPVKIPLLRTSTFLFLTEALKITTIASQYFPFPFSTDQGKLPERAGRKATGLKRGTQATQLVTSCRQTKRVIECRGHDRRATGNYLFSRLRINSAPARPLLQTSARPGFRDKCASDRRRGLCARPPGTLRGWSGGKVRGIFLLRGRGSTGP